MQFFKATVTPSQLRLSPHKNHFRFQKTVFENETITIDVSIGAADPEVGINWPYVDEWEVVGYGEDWAEGDGSEVPVHVLAEIERTKAWIEVVCEEALLTYIKDCLCGGE